MSRSTFRVYFFTRDGQEITDHKFHGIEWSGSGSCLNTKGQHVSEHGGEKWSDKTGRIARTEVWGVSRGREVAITTADFGDDNAILVKWWILGAVEWFWLVDDVAAEKIAKQGERRAVKS